MKAVAVAFVLMAAVATAHAAATQTTHRAVGVVKGIDPKAGTVTLAHEPVPSMKWPAMTMAFQVQDKAMLGQLGEGKKVDVEFEQRGRDYVITGVK